MSHDHSDYEYDYEPVPGLPEELPPGEHIVWQGSPSWGAVARRVFHVNSVAVYVGTLVFLHWVYQMMQGTPLNETVTGLLWQTGLGLLALVILVLLARIYARSTMYTITNRRLVVRSGVALPMMTNIPWDQVASAGLRQCSDGTGDVVLQLGEDQRVSYLALWPSIRPWRWSRIEPMLRGVAEPETVAQTLFTVVSANAEGGDKRVDAGLAGDLSIGGEVAGAH